MPILVSSNLCTASRIVVVFGEPVQDLGIWAYRTVGSDGINQGSAVAFAEAVLGHAAESQDEKVPKSTQESTATALLLANTGQLIWHCGSQRAMTQPTWQALPRGSAADPAMTMTRRNKIPGHANWEEHVEYIFDEVLSNRGRLVKDDARIDVIGVAEGAQAAMRYLARNCKCGCSALYEVDVWELIVDATRERVASIYFRGLSRQSATYHERYPCAGHVFSRR